MASAESASRPREGELAEDDYGLPAEPDWREIDWEAEVRRVEVDGRTLSYVDVGAGEATPVVLVHGLGGSWRNWLENIRALATERRVVACDLPGFGESAAAQDEISVSGYARVVDRLCEELGLSSVIAIGNSMGGFVAAELAVAFPERVERLVLVDAAGVVPAARDRRRATAALELTGFLGARLASTFRAVATRPRLRRLALGTVAHRPERLAPDLVLYGLLTPVTPAYREALHATLGYLSHDWAEQLRTVRCPALVVWGDRDAIMPVGHGERFVELIPGAESLVMPDTGHIPMIERPRAFNRAVLEFLGRAYAERPRST